jgi:hypothetical protein
MPYGVVVQIYVQIGPVYLPEHVAEVAYCCFWLLGKPGKLGEGQADYFTQRVAVKQAHHQANGVNRDYFEWACLT